MKTIAIASDHAAYGFKTMIIEHLTAKGVKCKDFGAAKGVTVSDYPDFALPVAKAVAKGDHNYGILICGTGIGMSIAANKVKGIRAALCGDTFSAKATREHNNSNILCLGERVISQKLALEIVDIFLNTEFSNEERHIRRISKIEK
ncbi:MAG: ribose 5-phosphate isomerase B [Firmicutes bacterium]|nr:ribose 5-phosphate isomerase B [Bacillota bacterium]